MSVKKPVIDLGYRPQSYFWPITHDTHVIAAIKGERRRSAIRDAFDADRVTPLDELYATPTLPDEDRRALGRLHPSFMGGEYLPDRRDTEVEIARINIDSTTSDVTSVYAKAARDRLPRGTPTSHSTSYNTAQCCDCLSDAIFSGRPSSYSAACPIARTTRRTKTPGNPSIANPRSAVPLSVNPCFGRPLSVTSTRNVRNRRAVSFRNCFM